MALKSLVSAVSSMSSNVEVAVFIDTSMGTCMAIPISPNISTGDFRRKFEREHFNCFPELGEIMVNSLTVKRKSHFYHLTESPSMMHYFHAFKGNLFLHADACSVDRKQEESTCVTTDKEMLGFSLPDYEKVETEEKVSSNFVSDTVIESSSEEIAVTGIIRRYFSDFEKVISSSEAKTPQNMLQCRYLKDPGVTTSDGKHDNSAVWKRILMASDKLGVHGSNKEGPSISKCSIRSKAFEISDSDD